ncbi:MAG TPA: NADH-quinone oxidoreductase subunit J [Syntrophorhabdaceae bacterium]|jgi:NADH-quinone oxidoreductase subunit J
MIAVGFKWFIFSAMAIIAVGSSLMMVTRRNPIHSALWLIVAFCSLAGIYVLLNATFMALAQVMVYAGAIMMLVLFVIMLIHLESDLVEKAKRSFPKAIGAIITILLFVQVAAGIAAFQNVGKKGAITPEVMAAAGNAQVVGSMLYGKYAFAFEVASVLLLVGIVGAVVLAKRVRN